MCATIVPFPFKGTVLGEPNFNPPPSPRVSGGQSEPAAAVGPYDESITPEGLWPELYIPTEAEIQAWIEELLKP